MASGLHPFAMLQPRSPAADGRVCVVTPIRQQAETTGFGADVVDDVPQILQAFADCDGGGTVVFPKGARYTIASRLNPVVKDVTVHWHGVWEFSTNLTYWRANGYPIAFQNHQAGFVLSGERISINGHGTGGIDGGGDSWYAAEQGVTQAGRPMPFVLWNVSDVVVRRFSVVQSPLWSINVMNGSNLWFDDIYVNNTATTAPPGKNWVQNTDGFDTMDAHNLTIHGGNGVAIGSLGQYPEEDSSVANVVVRDVRLIARNSDMHNSAYIKTWVGETVFQPRGSYESAGKPNGGGRGSVTNVVFANFHLDGAGSGPAIDQDSGNNGRDMDRRKRARLCSLLHHGLLSILTYPGLI
ncbi:galacturan 1,4-alpha-galacturonidase C [Sporothrix brasiliensis 5110]|uniref:galacturonan 1,4-alpha-galacturonidase n=1 Tax=Sporothrix brasiliensis 5110 TaxID=1398154 RepID=A0A0C2FGW7_9PEZI|nr:galacturan 1,4-alpha-galacturonidase C [Sporothrix brasiliensis 5110]KIH90318.1 galacturan 1,4-alpha-galacturonidase C [Sporothrix brasiliensis 5110]